MKATGIVRRIDELGRVVIPKEIRRTMRIREGDPLEIFTDREGEVIFKKYSPVEEMSEMAQNCASALHRVGGFPVVISDRDHVVAVAGLAKKDLVERKVSGQLEALMEQRKAHSDKTGESLQPFEEFAGEAVCAVPIVSGGDLMGAVVALRAEGAEAPEQPAELLKKLCESAALILAGNAE